MLKLTKQQVDEIKNLAMAGMSYTAIAKIYGVNVSQISKIVRGLSRAQS